MGHSHSEMWSPLHEPEIKSRYKKECAAEIEEIISQNTYTIDVAQIGDKLEWYQGLLIPSKVSPYPGWKPSSKVLDNVVMNANMSNFRYFAMHKAGIAPTVADKDKKVIYFSKKPVYTLDRLQAIAADPRWFQPVE